MWSCFTIKWGLEPPKGMPVDSIKSIFQYIRLKFDVPLKKVVSTDRFVKYKYNLLALLSTVSQENYQPKPGCTQDFSPYNFKCQPYTL